jgi:hypothetical protein
MLGIRGSRSESMMVRPLSDGLSVEPAYSLVRGRHYSAGGRGAPDCSSEPGATRLGSAAARRRRHMTPTTRTAGSGRLLLRTRRRPLPARGGRRSHGGTRSPMRGMSAGTRARARWVLASPPLEIGLLSRAIHVHRARARANGMMEETRASARASGPPRRPAAIVRLTVPRHSLCQCAGLEGVALVEEGSQRR